MNSQLAVHDAPTFVQRLIRIYAYLLTVTFALVPAGLIAYLRSLK